MNIRVKKSFTLIELVIVIILISIIYFVSFSNSMFFIKKNNTNISLVNTKEFLLDNFTFENDISLICIEEDYKCFVFIDSILQDDLEIKNLFKTTPEIYKYVNNQERKTFNTVEIDDSEYDIIFELKINSDFLSNEFILDTLDNKVYIFNSMFKKPLEYEFLNEAFDSFENKKEEVKDAF